MPSSHQDAWRPLAPAQVCPSSALQTALGRSLCSYGEQSSSPAGSPSPGSPRLSFAPQTSRAFKSQSSESKKKIPVPAFTRFPRPVPPSNPRPQSGPRSGSSRRAGVLQPRFFPWTQLQPWLPGNPGELSRRRTSLAGETPSATCWTRAGRSPYTWGPGSGVWVPRLFQVLRDGVTLFSVPALPA